MEGLYSIKNKNGTTSWGIDYRFNGQRIRKVIGSSKKLAEDVLHKRKAEIAEGKHLDIQKNKEITFSEFSERYIDLHAKHKKSWRSSYNNSIKRLLNHFGSKPLYKISPSTIEEYRNQRLGSGLTVASVNRELACLRSMFNKAVDWDDLTQSPMRKIKLTKENNERVRYLSKAEYSRLLEHCSDALRAVVVLAVNTGLRKSEIQRLSFNDVNFETGTLTIAEQKNGKKDFLPLNQTVKDLLLELKQQSQSDYPFNYNFRKAFETAMKKAKIHDFRFHDLRHTFASWLVIAGVDIYSVKTLMRHQDIKMTIRYAHLDPEMMARSVGRLDSLRPDGLSSTNTSIVEKAVTPL
jgi:integrase